jgi:hypothetical protein
MLQNPKQWQSFAWLVVSGIIFAISYAMFFSDTARSRQNFDTAPVTRGKIHAPVRSSANSSSTNATIHGPQPSPNVLRLPDAALRFDPDLVGHDVSGGLHPAGQGSVGSAGEPRSATVYVVGPGGRPEPKTVRIGMADDNFTELLSGLSAGDRVIVRARIAVPQSN